MNIRVGTVFSGIGAPEEGLRQLGVKHSIVFACDNGERKLTSKDEEYIASLTGLSNVERDKLIAECYSVRSGENLVQKTYCANNEIEARSFYQDVRYLDGNEYNGKLDLFIGGSPCQSFSVMGKRKGLEEARGTLFYEYARLVKEIRPRVFIYENVPGMLNHDGGNTWKVISHIFSDLSYHWLYWVLNAKDYGLAQNRRRLFVVGFSAEYDEQFKLLVKPEKEPLTTTTADYLEHDIPNKYYLPEKGFYRATDKKNAKYVAVNTTISRTQVACQQSNWFGDMRFETVYPKRVADDPRIFKGEYKGEMGVARCLTPRECLRLMGFSDDFKIVVPDAVMYRQSGNSIAVNVIKKVLSQIIRTGVFDE
ncbi:DNA cytosine methyltransferase [Bacteroides acidifaciens]|uniref:DNA cytosine methyltransferase n=1 Tax=Bacteroides acidifaciens TaxID=85831 RepID=UPI002616DBE8|nr:DNA (cytosine-5-)-methyltransferase [Bacteroides acidifaciens]